MAPPTGAIGFNNTVPLNLEFVVLLPRPIQHCPKELASILMNSEYNR